MRARFVVSRQDPGYLVERLIELIGRRRKPKRTSRAVIEAYQHRIRREDLDRAARSAANRLERALG